MNRERDIKVLRSREHGVVARVAVRDASDRKRAHERTLATVLDRTLTFARRRGGIAQ